MTLYLEKTAIFNIFDVCVIFANKSFLQSRYLLLQIDNVDMETKYQASEIHNIIRLYASMLLFQK